MAMLRIKGSVFCPGDPRYDEARKIWNGAIATRPALIAQCADEEDAAAWRKSSPASYTLLFHLGGAIARISQDESAYAGRQAVHAININAAWTGGGPKHADIAWARAFFAAMQPHATGGVYVNFLTNEGEERVRAAYGANYDRLAAIKARYDPDNLFRANQNIRPR